MIDLNVFSGSFTYQNAGTIRKAGIIQERVLIASLPYLCIILKDVVKKRKILENTKRQHLDFVGHKKQLLAGGLASRLPTARPELLVF